MIPLRDLVDTAQRHGLHVSLPMVHAAVDDGELVPAQHRPMAFSEAEANRWLRRLATAQRVRFPTTNRAGA